MPLREARDGPAQALGEGEGRHIEPSHARKGKGKKRKEKTEKKKREEKSYVFSGRLARLRKSQNVMAGIEGGRKANLLSLRAAMSRVASQPSGVNDLNAK